MLYLLQQVDFLEYLSLRKVILHIILFNCFDRNLLSSQFVNSKRYLTKSTLADELHKLVEIESRRREFVVLFDVLLYVLYQLVSFLQNGVVHSGCWFLRCPIA
jgi:hypothetical protein